MHTAGGATRAYNGNPKFFCKKVTLFLTRKSPTLAAAAAAAGRPSQAGEHLARAAQAQHEDILRYSIRFKYIQCSPW